MTEDRDDTKQPQEETTTDVTVEDLEELALFSEVPEWALARLAESAIKKLMPQDSLVVQQNDEARALYVLLEGTVHILVHFEDVGELLMGVQREPGSLIGWSTFRSPHRYMDSVRCEESSWLLGLPREAFEEVFAEAPFLGYQILKRVATTVDNRLEGADAFLESPYTSREQ